MDEITSLLKQIHTDCHKLLKRALNQYYPVAGNIGIFCQSEKEYKKLKRVQKELTFPSSNPNQKYYELIDPIKIPAQENIPEATYTHLYIRKPDPSPYGRYKGDVDFIMENKEYEDYKTSVLTGEVMAGVEIYDRPGWDTIQLTDPKIQSVAYISTRDSSEKVRVKFD